MRLRSFAAPLTALLLCACPYEQKKPKVIERNYVGGGAAAHPGLEQSPDRQMADANRPPPMIRPPDAKSGRKRRRRRAQAEMELTAEDMGADDDVDDSSGTAKDKAEKPEPEPEGPLVQRKSQNADAAAPEAKVDVSKIKALPVVHGRVKFPPPPEGDADQEELDDAMAAKNTKMNLPKEGALKIGSDGGLSVDPSSLGSYHVQVSTSAYFRRNLIDQVYGFGSDIHLEDDVEQAGGKTGKYFIRWALIDLLDMEHPFHRPKYFTYIAPLPAEDSGTSAARPGAPSPR
ncbi:MAG: hypothetical protein HY077_13860 [Elusimicrobia bacterium]|nr:hypothetical protein [Elusimicrobiota bacterium]